MGVFLFFVVIVFFVIFVFGFLPALYTARELHIRMLLLQYPKVILFFIFRASCSFKMALS